jgi:2-methylisocitrate lyase-like PEP mutase family enzyme
VPHQDSPLSADDQLRRAVTFRDLHAADHTFVMPNPWDAGSARLLSGLGFPALATTSAGLAFSLGVPDGADRLGRDDVLANARAIVAATHLPVSADLESGYADTADAVGDTIRLAAAAGLVGGSVEDSTADRDRPIRPVGEAAERAAAAVAAATALPFPFTVTARAENFLHGRADLDDTITRLLAYQYAGAHVLYAPGLPDEAAVRAVCAAVARPVNVVAGLGNRLSVGELAACGVRRVSLGSGFARAALGGLLRAAHEVRDHGTFTFLADAVPGATLNAALGAAPAGPSTPG